MKPDDRTLVRRCLEGDIVAFEGLLGRYEAPVFNLALRMLGNREDARDVTQSVFLKAYRGLETFDLDQRFFSWIYRIAVNESLNALDRRRATAPLADDRLATTDHGPAESAESAERQVAVRSALMHLAPDHRAVIVLRHYVGCSYAEMARILEVAEKTVKSRLYSARQQLKEALATAGVEKR